MMLSKNVFPKSFWYSPKKNGLRKDLVMFDMEKWLWKSEFCMFNNFDQKFFKKFFTTHFLWSIEYWLHFQKFVTNSVDTVKTLYRLDGLSIIEDTIAVLHKAVNRWRTITSPLYDSSRPNSLTRVLDLEAKKYEEMEFERYSFFPRYSFFNEYY